MPRQRVARLEELAPGSLRRIEVDGEPVCLVRTKDGRVRAIGDTCTHEHASLSEGTIVGNAVECIDHGSLFDLDTGDVLSLPAELPVKTYRVTVEDGEVVIDT